MKKHAPVPYVLTLPDFSPTTEQLPYSIRVFGNDELLISRQDVRSLRPIRERVELPATLCTLIRIHIDTPCGCYYREVRVDPLFSHVRSAALINNKIIM